MSENQNPDLENGNGGEPVAPSEADAAKAAEAAANSDPLDAITDEQVRADAKRDRAIAQRVAKREVEEKTEPTKEPEAEPTSSKFVTKDDLNRMATIEAKKQVAPEIKEVWDELTKIQLGGFDPMDADSIVANMQQRYTLYRIDNPVEGEDPAKVFETTNHVPTSGGEKKEPSKKAAPSLPGLKEPVSPVDWYPAKK